MAKPKRGTPSAANYPLLAAVRPLLIQAARRSQGWIFPLFKI